VTGVIKQVADKHNRMCVSKQSATDYIDESDSTKDARIIRFKERIRTLEEQVRACKKKRLSVGHGVYF